MKLLIDNALSPVVAEVMNYAGHDAIHLRGLDMQSAPDVDVFALAERQDRIIISADTDFGALLALRRAPRPSFILFRKTTGVRPRVIADQLKWLLAEYRDDIEAGCILTVTNEHIRVRSLPIH